MSKEEKAVKLTPGSDAALDLGCTCPVIDNGHGRGYMGQPDIFVITDDCPLHGSRFAALEAKEGGDGN